MEQLLYAVDYEFHLPGMNFLGGGTKVTDRLSLNYGGSRGTKNYMIPTTKKDYVAFEHDLLYFSPDSTVKKFADSQFLLSNKLENNVFPLIEDIAIYGQQLLRQGYDITKVAVTGITVYNLLKNTYNLINKMGIVGETVSTKKIRLLRTQLENKARETYSQLDVENRPVQLTLMKDIINKIDEEIKNNPRITFGESLQKLTFNFLPQIFMLSNYLIPETSKNIIEFYNQIKSSFIKNPDYIQIKNESDKVKNKYDSYLKEVGSWRKIPLYNVVRFDVKDINQINHNIAEKKYIDFYNQYKKYLEFINNKYKNDPIFKPYEIKELNMDNINLIKTPEQLPQAVFDDLVNIINDIDNKIRNIKRTNKEELDEIEKVLKKEIDVPFETPVPEIKIPTEDYGFEYGTFEKEKKAEIEKVLSRQISEPFKTEIEYDLPDIELSFISQIPIVEEPKVEEPYNENHDNEALKHIFNVEIQPQYQPHFDYPDKNILEHLYNINAM